MGNIKNKRQIKRLLNKSKNIFLMAHDNLDLDALGSSIGLYNILTRMRKQCFLIIDEKEHELGVEKILRELDGCIKIIKGDDVEKNLNPRKKKNLLIILDTNKEDMVQNKKILNKFNKKLIIDHHETGKKTIIDAELYIKKDASSTCEMVTEMLEYLDIDLDAYYATLLLSGIVLDTNNFTLKTSSNTYYTAYYLTCLGASARKVQYLLKQDLKEYTEREQLLTSVELINNKIAITKGNTKTKYRKEDLAKVADSLLFFNDIEASFVIGKIDESTIGLSARSLGNFNINKLLEKIGGGGDDYHGASVFKKKTINEVEQILLKEIKKQEGE